MDNWLPPHFAAVLLVAGATSQALAKKMKNELSKRLLGAADTGDLQEIKNLVEEGADLDYRDQYGNSPLSNAGWKGHIEAVKLLHELGADLNQPCYEDSSLIMHAAFNAQMEIVRFYLENGADPNQTNPENGETLLHTTISKTNQPKRTELVTLFVDAGADVNAKTIPGKETGCFMRDAFLKGETPLHRAAAYGDKDMINALLKAGADPSTKDANGDTPISWGSWHLRPLDVLGLLLYGEVPGWHGCPNPNLDGKDLS